MGSGSKFIADFEDFFERLEGVPWRACPTRLPALSEAMGREQKGLTALSFLKTAPPPKPEKWPKPPPPTKNPEAFQLRDSLVFNEVRATGLEPERGCPH